MLALETSALLHYIDPNNRRHFGQDQQPLPHLGPSLLVNPRPTLLCHALLLNQQPYQCLLNGAHSRTVGSDQTNHYSLASVRDTDHYRRPDFSLSSGLVSSKLLGIASRSLLPGPVPLARHNGSPKRHAAGTRSHADAGHTTQKTCSTSNVIMP